MGFPACLCAQNSAIGFLKDFPKIGKIYTYGKKIALFWNQWFSAVTKLIFKLFDVFKRSWSELFIFLIKNIIFLLQWDQNQWLSGPKKSKFEKSTTKFQETFIVFFLEKNQDINIDLKFHSGSNGSTPNLWKSLSAPSDQNIFSSTFGKSRNQLSA